MGKAILIIFLISLAIFILYWLFRQEQYFKYVFVPNAVETEEDRECIRQHPWLSRWIAMKTSFKTIAENKDLTAFRVFMSGRLTNYYLAADSEDLGCKINEFTVKSKLYRKEVFYPKVRDFFIFHSGGKSYNYNVVRVLLLNYIAKSEADKYFHGLDLGLLLQQELNYLDRDELNCLRYYRQTLIEINDTQFDELITELLKFPTLTYEQKGRLLIADLGNDARMREFFGVAISPLETTVAE